jgi:hypothetical protein
MGRKVNRVNVSPFLENPNRAISEISQEVEDFTIEAAKFGEERIKHYIMTKGTNRTWGTAERPNRWWSAKTNRYRTFSTQARYDSGDMYNAVGTTIQAGPKESRAGFGWTRQNEDYFQYQDGGFNHYKTGQRVEGMFALRDSRRDVVNELPKLAKKYAKRISKRISQ